MNEEDRRIYTLDRTLHSEQTERERQLLGLREIIVHNAIKTREVEDVSNYEWYF